MPVFGIGRARVERRHARVVDPGLEQRNHHSISHSVHRVSDSRCCKFEATKEDASSSLRFACSATATVSLIDFILSLPKLAWQVALSHSCVCLESSCYRLEIWYSGCSQPLLPTQAL